MLCYGSRRAFLGVATMHLAEAPPFWLRHRPAPAGAAMLGVLAAGA